MAGGRDKECDGDMDGTVSGGNDNSSRVAAARLAAQSQYMRNNARTRRNDLAVSPGQPANSRIPFYGLPRMSRRCRKITFKPRNISRTRKVKITYLGRANAMRLMWRPGNRIRWPRNVVAEYESQGERREVEDYLWMKSQRVDQQRSSDLTRHDYYQIGQSRRSHKPSHTYMAPLTPPISNVTVPLSLY